MSNKAMVRLIGPGGKFLQQEMPEDGSRQFLFEGDNLVVSDGYHTFEELYDHRITLFMALCYHLSGSVLEAENPGKYFVWKSKKHSDGKLCFGDGRWFVMGIGKDNGKQITYHLPIEKWEEIEFAETLDQAPEFDGHTPSDVLKRLKNLYYSGEAKRLERKLRKDEKEGNLSV